MITTDIKDKVARLVINDGNLNILDPVLTTRLLQAVQFVVSNRDVNTLLLEGNGRAFSAGLDLDTVKVGGAEAQKLFKDMGSLLDLLYQSRLRVVSLCAGHALGAGALLLLVSDFRVGVSQSGRIGFPEVGQGFPLPELSVALAKDRLNPKDLFAATALSRLYSPDDARTAGFLDMCFSNYRDAGYRAQKEAETLSALDDKAYETTALRVRG